MRFGELASAMTDISERMLAVRLKNLESHNLITEEETITASSSVFYKSDHV